MKSLKTIAVVLTLALSASAFAGGGTDCPYRSGKARDGDKKSTGVSVAKAAIPNIPLVKSDGTK